MLLIAVLPHSRLDLEGNTHFTPKPNSDLNHLSFRSSCLSPQLEVNHPHSLGQFYAFIVGVEPPLRNCGADFHSPKESEGVLANINISFQPNIRCYRTWRCLLRTPFFLFMVRCERGECRKLLPFLIISERRCIK